MMSTKAMSKNLLRPVSRSFYLSMKMLPRDMREPVSLGYLLARASDTIADTASVPQELRMELLETFRKRVAAKGENSEKLIGQLIKDFIPHQEDEGEKQLLEQLSGCFVWLNRMERADQFLVIKVLGHITKGQLWDTERFGTADQENPGFIETGEELEQYTYWVAGSVGVFWTEVGYSNYGRNFSLEANGEMKELGRNYGKGLQLVNILRDVGEDLRNGRCYLPKEELIENGWDGVGEPSEESLLKVSKKWRDQCREWIQSGQQYAGHLRSRRIRFATVLPLLIAERTVDLIEEAGTEVFQKKVKVTRGEIRKMIARAMFS